MLASKPAALYYDLKTARIDTARLHPFVSDEREFFHAVVLFRREVLPFLPRHTIGSKSGDRVGVLCVLLTHAYALAAGVRSKSPLLIAACSRLHGWREDEMRAHRGGVAVNPGTDLIERHWAGERGFYLSAQAFQTADARRHVASADWGQTGGRDPEFHAPPLAEERAAWTVHLDALLFAVGSLEDAA